MNPLLLGLAWWIGASVAFFAALFAPAMLLNLTRRVMRGPRSVPPYASSQAVRRDTDPKAQR